MTGTTSALIVALVAFVGSHLLLSHPLRAPLVGALGEKAFSGIYSLVALATLVWVVLAYRAAPDQALWSAPSWMRWVVAAVMLLASVLMAGSFVGPNPFFKMAARPLMVAPAVGGVFALTRHPMMWSFGLWGLAHAAVNGNRPTVLLGLGVALLALGGAALQDGKLAARFGAPWNDFAARTSFWPFAAVASGRVELAAVGVKAVVAGVVLFAVLAAAHPWLTGVPAIPF